MYRADILVNCVPYGCTTLAHYDFMVHVAADCIYNSYNNYANAIAIVHLSVNGHTTTLKMVATKLQTVSSFNC